ncbi:hypothetical protein ACQPW1_39460 [Nocardia sp. CA-128927]|uniref:hypothetical protein n=1 Tax=Nocardia sp. CA-128927 TaxID=3239975 RepID=UPI003D999DD6
MMEINSGSLGRGAALAVVRSKFDQIARNPVFLTAGVVAGLGDQDLRADQLRDLLLDPALPITTVDAAWVYLVGRSRAEGGDATLACAGIAWPMLTGVAARLSRWARDQRDLEAAILAGFVAALAQVDLDRRFVLHRLRWAAYRSGYACAKDTTECPTPQQWLVNPTGADGNSPAQRWVMRAPVGHPEFVLAQAVAEGVISEREAELIACTRLERRMLTSVAAERGVSYKALEQTRRRAEHKLAAHLAQAARDTDGARTSVVEAAALSSPSVLTTARRPQRRAKKSGRPLLKTVPAAGVKGCGNPSAAPAQTAPPKRTPASATSPEVRRCA